MTVILWPPNHGNAHGVMPPAVSHPVTDLALLTYRRWFFLTTECNWAMSTLTNRKVPHLSLPIITFWERSYWYFFKFSFDFHSSEDDCTLGLVVSVVTISLPTAPCIVASSPTWDITPHILYRRLIRVKTQYISNFALKKWTCYTHINNLISFSYIFYF